MRAIIAVLALLVAHFSYSAPKAASPQECMAFADYALVARALVMDGQDQERIVAILSRIYTVPGGDGRIVELLAYIRSAAQRDGGKEASDFANRLGAACMENGGNMDAVLGEKS